MNSLNKEISSFINRPIKIIQFGEGNFLRAFVDYMVDIANEKELLDSNIVLIKPIEYGNTERFDKQECQYTVKLQGRVDEEKYTETRPITCIDKIVDPFINTEEYFDLARLDTLRFIVSNTTEAGIVYNENDKYEEKINCSFPAKLVHFLYVRYNYFNGDDSKGVILLPVELIDNNGDNLKECVNKYIDLWNMDDKFKKWINDTCVFTNTLVDRIVTGYPKDEITSIWEELGYQDELLVTAEPFGLWVIESSKDISKEFPLDKAMEDKKGMQVLFTDNQKPYKERKVRILNGAHTSFVLLAYLYGYDYVNESIQDNLIKKYLLDTIYNEIIPTLSLSKEECESFAEAVIDRFNNPFIKHALLDISLNSVSKYRARCLPSLLGYINKFNKLPEHLVFSIASLMEFYNSDKYEDGILYGYRNDKEYLVKDDKSVLEFFSNNYGEETESVVAEFLSNEEFFGEDLTKYEGLQDLVVKYLSYIKENGMKEAVAYFFGG